MEEQRKVVLLKIGCCCCCVCEEFEEEGCVRQGVVGKQPGRGDRQQPLHCLTLDNEPQRPASRLWRAFFLLSRFALARARFPSLLDDERGCEGIGALDV